MKQWSRRKSVLSLTILAVTLLLLLVVAFTWESTGDSPLNLLIPHRLSWGGKSNVSKTSADSWRVDLAVGGTDIHVVWRENIGTDAKIRFRNKDKDDTSWSSAKNLATAGKCLHPAIAVVQKGTGDRIHVVWEDYSGGNYRDILYRKSLDGGSTWDARLSITSDDYHAYAPAITMASTIPHVVWHGDSNGDNYTEILYSKYNGSWTAPYIVSTSGTNEYPAIAIDGSDRIHVTWHDIDEGIKYRRKSGAWSGVKKVSGGDSSYPDIAAKGNYVYVAWNTKVAANQYRVRCRRWKSGSWATATTIATVTTAPISPYPSPRISIDSSDTVHVVWQACPSGVDPGECKQEIWHSQSTDKGANWSSAVNISDNSDAPSQLGSTDTDSEGDVHVAWQEQVSGQWDIFHIRSDGDGGGGGGDGGVYLPIIMKDY